MEDFTDADTGPMELPTVYLFGFRELRTLCIDPTPLGKFVMGGDVPLDAELARALRIELSAMERYRLLMVRAIARVCGEIIAEASATVGPIEHPITGVHTAFWRGYALGKYEAFSVAASMLSEVSITTAIGLETGDDESPALGES